jgi:hypothetical protein
MLFQTLRFCRDKGGIQTTSGNSLRIRFENLDTWHDVQVYSWEEAQKNKLWESCHLDIQILVRNGKGRSSE